MAFNPKIVAVVILGVLAALLIYGAILTFTLPSTTLYFFIFPIATAGPSFVVYLGGIVMLAAGIVLAYLTYKVAF